MIDKRKLLKEEEGRLLSKWEPFLEGIEDSYVKINTAMLLENEAEYLTEADADAVTATSDVTGIQKIMLPIVRRVFPNLIANNIVSVQPMAGPAAVIFYLKYVFGTSKGNVTQTAEYSAFSATAPVSHPDEGWQGYSPYYSKQTIGPWLNSSSGADITGWDLTAGGAGNPGDQTHDSMKWAAAQAAEVAISGVIIEEIPTDLDNNESGGEVIYSFTATGGTDPGVILDVYGTVYTDFTIGGFNDGSIDITNANGNPYRVEINWEVDMEFSEDIPEMKITISQIPVVAKTRKLKAHWSNEAEQDLKAYHNLNAEAELTSLVSNEMIAEIDREIVRKCMFSAATKGKFNWRWDTNNNTVGNYLDRHLALINKIIETSNEIYRKSKIGPANWIVTSTRIASQIEVLRGFIPNPVTATGGLGIVKAGNYAGKFDVYKDPLFPEEKILMGHKSPVSPFGAGVVYSPYVTQLTPVIYGPDDFTPRRGFIARYGLVKVPLGELLYALMDVDFSTAEGTA